MVGVYTYFKGDDGRIYRRFDVRSKRKSRVKGKSSFGA